MPQATITPRFVNPPKINERTGQPARSATVKDDQGGFWGIHPGDMQKFQIGVPITIDYIQNGRYYNVTSIVGQQAPANPQAQHVLRPSGNTPRVPQPNPQTQDEAKKSENIFVTTVVQAAIAQQYPLEEGQLTLLVQMARSAWRGDQGVRLNNPGRGDEPPFPGSPDDYGDVDQRG